VPWKTCWSCSQRPGQPALQDYEYKREGTANIFMQVEPLAGWRHVDVTERRTKLDFAEQMRQLVDVHYPEAACIRIVMDNLNTHTRASLYAAYKPSEALRLLKRLEFHYTPKHGSWLNPAESEISALERQCLDRRIADTATLCRETSAWQDKRNQQRVAIKWRFTAPAARDKLRHLYPQIPSRIIETDH
jgi:transposase